MINFDDLELTTGEPAPIPDGYFGLDWDSNWRCVSHDMLPGIEPSSWPNAAELHNDGWNVLQENRGNGSLIQKSVKMNEKQRH